MFAAYLAIGLWWTWPLATVAATHAYDFRGTLEFVQADFQLLTWILSWDAHALVTAPWRLFHANVFHPSTLALAYSESLLGHLPLFAPAYWASGNPILATNAAILLLQPLCAIAMYALARRFAPPPAAFVAGALYAFFPWRAQQVAAFHLLGVQYLPLALLFTERWLERARWSDAALLALCLVLQGASSFYLAYALLLAYGVYLPPALLGWRDRLDARRLVGIACALAALAAAMAALGAPYAYLRSLGLIRTYDDAGDALPLGLVPQATAHLVRHFVRAQSFGPLAWGLAAIAVVPPWRGRGRAVAIGAALVAVGLVAAHGPQIAVAGSVLWSPYELAVRWLPGFSSVRIPVRFVLVAQLGLALLAGVGLARLVARLRPPLAWGVAAAASVTALWLSLTPALPGLVAQPIGADLPPEARWLAEHGDGRPLLELPRGDLGTRTARMIASTAHWLPLIDGYSGYMPDTATHVHALADGLPSEHALAAILDLVDVGWIAVHLDELQPEERARWEGPAAAPLASGLMVAARWPDVLLLRVERTADRERQSRLLSADETPGGVPLRRLADDCAGALRLHGAPPSPWPSGRSATLELEVENRGSQAWPGFGFVPRHRVEVVACFRRTGQGECRAETVRLPADVPAGGAVRWQASLRAPAAPGEYELELSLQQHGDGSLDRCGIAPVRLAVRVAPVPAAH